ncbi:TlpA disulfide reductase family protein [Hyphomicrobium sp.]|uniref:TlpA family protein disulfide reductase n=1 Tax=Hyphomicrobium sp. TaxID=82 RepID=UPI002CFF1503|nr:TlpA disulfide reductase family protein [Hyphomicrobium sp.]HVZ05009.1 TlpA disulfide reductase family protein [Hyphomicrobium sp.]
MKTVLRFIFPLFVSLSTISLAKSAEIPQRFDATGWRNLLASHRGQPLIVHFWGFTCGNCMVELKDWGAFAQQHPDIPIVFVNWDRRGADPAHIAQTLEKMGLGRVKSFTLADGFEEKLRFAVDHDWLGELPFTRLITPGGVQTAFSGTANFSDLSKWIDAHPAAPRK